MLQAQAIFLASGPSLHFAQSLLWVSLSVMASHRGAAVFSGGDLRSGRAVLCPFITGRYEGATVVDAAHICCGCSICGYKRCTINPRGRRLPCRINSLRRIDEAGSIVEVDIHTMEAPAGGRHNLNIVSGDHDIFYLQWSLPTAALGDMDVQSRWNFSSSNWRCWLK